MIEKNYISIVLLGLTLFILGSCKLSKGFEALEQYNYFEAKKAFEKSLKKNEAPSAYGLSEIYFRNDNPFHNLDSAYHYSLLSVEAFKKTKEKKHKKWAKKLDFTLLKAKNHRKEISDLAFEMTVRENTVSAFKYFIAKHPWSAHKDQAMQSRDSLAFLNAKEVGTSSALQDYLRKYSDSDWKFKAQSLLYRTQFNETVKEGNTLSYVNFIASYPNNPLVRDAQFQVFSIETKNGTIPEYRTFIRRFPDNPFVDDAWTNLYRLSIANYEKSTIQKFAKDYPDFPFQDLIQQDLQLVGKKLYLIAKNGKYGFMNDEGEVAIAPTYEYAGQFVNGLAVVIKNDKYGYINKNGKLIIDYKFDEAMDFSDGRAIVIEQGKFGMIDVSGAYVLNPVYLDIGSFNQGVAYVEDENGFQYYTLDGSLAFSTVFDEAFSFDQGMAMVKKGENQGFIGLNGGFIVSTTEGELKHFKDSLFVHETYEGSNLMYTNGAYVFESDFDKIGPLVNNRAIVEKNGKYGYLNGKAEIVIPLKHSPFPNYMQFAQFENGHVNLKRLNKYAMMDSLGNSVFPAIFTGIGTYGDLIPVSKGKGWGYANHKVYLKIKYQYDYAYGFIDGKALVEKDGLMGLINLKNEEIVPIVHESVKRMNDGSLMIKSAGFYGLISVDNDTLVEAQYNRIQEVEPQLYQLIKGQDITYYDSSRNQILSLKE